MSDELCKPRQRLDGSWYCLCCGFDESHPKNVGKLNKFSRRCDRPCFVGAGDLIEYLAAPIVKAVGLKNCLGCKGRRDWLNRKTEKIFRFVRGD